MEAAVAEKAMAPVVPATAQETGAATAWPACQAATARVPAECPVPAVRAKAWPADLAAARTADPAVVEVVWRWWCWWQRRRFGGGIRRRFRRRQFRRQSRRFRWWSRR